MPQIIINTCSKISNANALRAISGFIEVNYKGRKSRDYMEEMEMHVQNGIKVLVKEVAHENQNKSPCSVVFNVTRAPTA